MCSTSTSKMPGEEPVNFTGTRDTPRILTSNASWLMRITLARRYSLVSTSDWKVQIDLLFLDGVVALHAMDLCSEYSLWARVSSGNTLEAWDPLVESRIAVSSKPRGFQMGCGGEWEYEVPFRSKGARRWMSVRRNGLALGRCFVLARTAVSAIRIHFDALLNRFGFSFYV